MFVPIAVAVAGAFAMIITVVYLYVRKKAGQLNEREVHIWFQKAFMGMTRREIQGLPDRPSAKKPPVRDEARSRG